MKIPYDANIFFQNCIKTFMQAQRFHIQVHDDIKSKSQ